MAQSSRRLLLRGSIALAAASPAAAVVAEAALNPDAELIRWCAEHIVNVDAFNRDGGYLENEVDPLWWAYRRTLDAINAAKPQTLEGVVAKARAAKAEARGPDGSDRPEDGSAARWAWHLVNDLLRLT